MRHLDKPSKGSAALGVVTVWLITATADQKGLHGLGLLISLFLLAGFSAGILKMLRQDLSAKRLQFVLSCLLLSTGFWFYFSGSYRSWVTLAWDIGGIAIGGLVGTAFLALALALIGRRTLGKTNLLTDSRGFLPICTIVAGWLAITLLTVWRQSPLPRDITRFEKIGPVTSIVPVEAGRWQALQIGLALSGGGYRAAVYHAGVLRALERLGIRVNVLSTVSGGSIIGAYYAVGGDPQAFKDAVADGRFNLRRELSLLHNALRMPFPFTVPVLDVRLFPWYEYSRRDAQAGLLRRTLFDDDESWRAPAPLQPRLVINVTDLTFGAQLGLMPDGAVMLWPSAEQEAFSGSAWALSEDLSLADRVAISGAFPGAFPARAISVRATYRKVTDERVKLFNNRARPMLLADGGIFENSGASMLRAVDQFARKPPSSDAMDARMASDIMFVSDAGAIFGVEPELGDFAQMMRAVDVSSSGVRGGSTEHPQVVLSAQERFAPPALQFQVYGAATFVQSLFGRNQMERYLTGSGFDRRANYPEPVLAEITALLPDKPLEAGVEALRSALEKSMDDRLRQFQDTSTLDDLLTRERAEALYALGQLMVYTAWPRIEREIDAALRRARESAKTTP